MEKIERLLEGPCWVIDILPERVPEEGGGRFFAAEKWFLEDPDLRRRQARFLLKLGCYHDLTAVRDGEEIRNPQPRELADAVGKEYLNILVGEDALLSADPTDIYMSLYGADGKLLALAEKLAAGEGLYVRKAACTDDRLY